MIGAPICSCDRSLEHWRGFPAVFLYVISCTGRSACGGREPGGAGAAPCGPLWPWTTPLPTQGGQPPCGRCRGLPTAAAAGTDALHVDKPAACPPSGCPTFLKFPSPLGDRDSRGPCREGGTGGAALGVWGRRPPAWERHRRGGDRLGDLDAPLWGAIEYPARGVKLEG